ncbi:B12-binding domain-containing radical SAM protein [Candidatus Woesearchaeota archaeon]|nr:B12-binding domain-containing radical SAM protein [Candidatus Woesearchaeota archaeon]
MKKKLLLIRPLKNDVEKFEGGFNPPPLQLGYIAALTPNNWDIQIVDECVKVEDYENISADLVGITTITSLAPRAYFIAGIFKRRGIPVILGGIHASFLTDEAMKYADVVIKGEAEGLWKTVIKDFEKKRLKKIYEGDLADMNNIPSAREDLYPGDNSVSALQTARGCPMNCEFCSVTSFNSNIYRQRPIKDVLHELEKTRNRAVFFVDDNIVGYGKKAEERAVELFKGISDTGLNKMWFGQASINMVNNDKVLKYASESGCVMLILGLESVNESSLKEYNKWANISSGINNYKKIIKKFHDYNIGVHGAFVLGSDTDDKTVFNKTRDFAIESEIETFQFTNMTPLPGTKIYTRLMNENRILFKNYPQDWELYDGSRCVFQPKNMSAEELEEGILGIYHDLLGYDKLFSRSFKSFLNTGNIATKRASEIISMTFKRAIRENYQNKYGSVNVHDFDKKNER